MEEANDCQRKSGQQIAKENVDRVRSYVEGLKLQGERIPLRKGQPNWSAIALACGFSRGVFYDNANAREVVQRAVEYEKLTPEATDETTTPAVDGRAAHLQRRLEGSDRHAQRLEERLAVVSAENEALKRENKELKERLREFSVFEEVIATSGKRYIP